MAPIYHLKITVETNAVYEKDAIRPMTAGEIPKSLLQLIKLLTRMFLRERNFMGIQIRNTACAGLIIEFEGRRVIIDAINTIGQVEKLLPQDILLFTHSDGDHFSVDNFPHIKGRDILVLGPQTIGYELLVANKLEEVLYKELYTFNNEQPQNIVIDNDVKVTCYNTPHFVGHNAVHNSYVLDIKGKRIYITGDSYLDGKLSGILSEIDCVVCNLVDEGYIKCTDDKRFAYYHHMSYLLNIKSIYNPTSIIAVHLTEFDGTVDAQKMKTLVDDSRIEGIYVLQSEEDIVEV